MENICYSTLHAGRIFLLLATTLGIAVTSHADPTGPAYPPPGGVTFSGTGNAGQASGRESFYTNFDETNLTELYWTFYSVANPRHSTQNGGASTGQMAFSSFNIGTGVATWNSTVNMIWSTASGTQNVATRLLVQFQPYTGTNSGLLGSGWLTPTTAASAGITSLTPATWPVLDVLGLPGTDSYQVWFRYEISGGSPLLTYYDGSNSLGGSVYTDQTGGFYSNSVPEPASAGLLTLGLVGLISRRSRKCEAN